MTTLLIRNADVLVTMDNTRREIAGGGQVVTTDLGAAGRRHRKLAAKLMEP